MFPFQMPTRKNLTETETNVRETARCKQIKRVTGREGDGEI